MNKRRYLSLFIAFLLLMEVILPASTFAAWNKPDVQASVKLNGITRGPDRFMAVGDNGKLLYSLDGSNGQFMGSIATGTTAPLNNIVYGGDKYVIVGGNGTILTWGPGNVFRAPNSSTTASLSGIAYGAGRYVATGQFSTVATSTDGVTWTSKMLPNTGGAYLFDVTYGDKFVAVGQYGEIWTSSDGTNWTKQVSNSDNYLQSITYGNGLYVAVGVGGRIVTSPDGVNWTVQNSTTTQGLYDVAYGDGRFVAVGFAGTMMTSSNGVNWKASSSGVTNSLLAVQYGNNTFVIVGNQVNLVYEDSSVIYSGNGHTGGTAPADSNKYAKGTSATVLGQGSLVRTGYTFAGWNTAADGSGTSYSAGSALAIEMDNVTLYAQWILAPTYTVTYNGNGSTSGAAPVDSRGYENGASVTVPGQGTLVRTGYTFAGWNTLASGNGTNYAVGSTLTMGSANVTLYAKWTLNPTYRVTYNGNGSTGGAAPTDSGRYENGASATVMDRSTLVRTGYTFAGWNTLANGSGTNYAAGSTLTMGSANVTLYAKWTLNPTYRVTYNGNGSTGGAAPTDSGRYENGASATVMDRGTLMRTGYTFAGWNTASNGSGTNYAAGAALTMGSANVTLYAKWTLNPTYGVTYNGNGSTGGAAPTDSGRYENGASATVMDRGTLVRTGYTFAGWNTLANGNGTNYAVGSTLTMGSANVTLYAKWTLNPTYRVTYNGNGSTSGAAPTDSRNYENGASATVMDRGTLVRTGYTFAGWNTAANGSGTNYAVGSTLTMGSANVTLYAKWTLIPTYTVTYNGNDNTGGTVPVDSGRYAAGSSATVMDKGTLVRAGYSFAGWNTAANGSGTNYAAGAALTMGTSNVTLYAKWTLIPTYTVTYNGNGSTSGAAPTDSRGYENGASATVMDRGTLVRTGYTFAGWNTAANGSGTNYAVGAALTMGSVNVTLYAKWTLIPTYTVTYNGNGSTSGTVPVDSERYAAGSSATVMDKGTLVRAGYSFAGWNTAANGSGTNYVAGAALTMGSVNVTLYAKWTLIPTYTVTYNGNGSTSGAAPTDSRGYENGASATVMDRGTLVRTGYTFAGWNTAANGSGTNYAVGSTLTMGSSNVTLYAKWTLNPTYTITYNGNGSTSGVVPTDSRGYENGASATVMDRGTLVRTGYTFAGWNTAANGSGTNYAVGSTLTMESSNVTLYAKWTLNPTYTITYNGNGSTSGVVPTDSRGYENGASATVMDRGTLVRTGYTFAGWNTAANGSGTNYAPDATLTMGSVNVTLYAKWTLIPTFTVTYNGNGSTSGAAPTDSRGYENGASATILDRGTLVRTGYTFAGWNTAANGSGTNYAPDATLTMGSVNVTLYAKWTLIPTFTVTYNGNGSTSGAAPTDSRDYVNGASATVMDRGTLVRTGYTFAGWNTAANGSGTNYAPDATLTMGAANVTLYAQWSLIPTYTVTYNGNENTGGTLPVDSGRYAAGSSATLMDKGTLVRAGYSFAGWNTAADGSGTNYAADATLTMGASDVTLYAQWSLTPTYAVTYNGNTSTGGSAPSDSGRYEIGATVTVMDKGTLVRAGYTFASWNTAADGSGTNYVADATLTMGATNVTLYAQWLLTPTYTVTYNGNGSTSGAAPTDSRGYENGASATVLDRGTLVRTGYIFAGWNTAADGSGTNYAADATLTMGSVNVTLYAQWSLTPTYTVTYNGNTSTGGAAPSDNGRYVSGTEVTVMDQGTLVKAGYTFAGWNTAADGSGTNYAADATLTMGTANVTLYAQWSLIPTYTVTYNGNNSTSGTVPVDGGTYEEATEVTVLKKGDLGRAGYTFIGWNTAVNGGGTSYAVDATFTMGSSNVTLYAQWRVIESSGGTSPGSYTPIKVVSSDGKLTLPAGAIGEISFEDVVKVFIPEGSTDKELKVTIVRDLNAQKHIAKEKLPLSGVFDILKNIPDPFKKNVTISFKFESSKLSEGQQPAVFYYDKAKKAWVEAAGGKIEGSWISIQANDFAKFTVLCVETKNGQSVPCEPADSVSPPTFSDISEHWAEHNIIQAVINGIAGGYPDGTFRPGHVVTRAEFAVMLMNVLKPQGEGASLKFKDKDKIGAWAQKSVAHAVEAGIIKGYEDGTFRPNSAITRAEMAVMLAKALKLQLEANQATGFADDQSIPSWAKGAAAAMKKLGMIKGMGANKFNPTAHSTRAEAVTVLFRMLSLTSQSVND